MISTPHGSVSSEAPQRKVFRRWQLLTDIPQIKLITGAIIAAVALIGLLRSITFGGQSPMLLPLLTALVSAVSVIVFDMRQRYGTTYMRLGFHGGILVFLTAVPIVSPETIGNADEQVRFTAGITLLLCMIGFEVAYWYVRTVSGAPRPMREFVLVPKNYTWVTRLLFVGLMAYAVFVTYAVASSGRSLYTMMFALRGRVEVDINEAMILPDETKNQIAFLLAYGRYMAAAAACILLLAPNPFRFPIHHLVCWFALLLCAFVGLNSGGGGSRGSFMLSAVPLLTTVWMFTGNYQTLRQLRPVFACLLVLSVLFGFQYLTAFRDQGNIQEVETNFEKVDLADSRLVAAFSIYKDYEIIVGGFPDKAAFQNGASIVPLLIGWVPRRFWPDKPYPFTSIANRILGLQTQDVSIAASLPGEGYGNFGVAGGLIWGALMGLACAFADFRLSNIRPGHPLALGMRGMMAVWAALIVRGGTPEMFYMGAFPIGFMWICLYFSQPRFESPAH
jgi:hypothetical protein